MARPASGVTAVLAGLLVLTTPWSGVLAQPLDPLPPAARDEALQERFETLIRRSRDDPTDLDTLYALAAAAIAIDDLETAISVLERLLIFNPDLPRVRLELGVLYFRLGSYDIAKLQLQRAIQGADTPEAVKDQVGRYLDAIAERTATHVLTTEVLFGVRHQTNPSTASDPTDVRIGDLVFETDDDKRSDQSLVALATVTHLRRMATQWDDAWLSRAQLYTERFLELTRLNAVVAELETGPSFGLARFDLPPGTVRPFINTAYVALDDSYYTAWLGGGVEVRVPFGERLQLRSRARVRYQDYTDTEATPDGDRRGVRGEIGIGGTLLLSPRDFVDGFAYLDNVGAEERFLAYQEVGTSLVAGHRFPLTDAGPLELLTVYAGGSVARARYREADPVIEPDTRRRDWSYTARAGAVAELGPRLALTTEISHQMISSNVSIYEYDNTSVLVGLKVRF